MPELSLFTVGPVCNLQDVIRQDPEALKLARRVVSMFGSFKMGYGGSGTKPEPEWNVRADIKAAQAFISAGANPVLHGLDTTTMVRLGEADRTRLLYRNSPLTDALSGLYILWRYESYAHPGRGTVIPAGAITPRDPGAGPASAAWARERAGRGGRVLRAAERTRAGPG